VTPDEESPLTQRYVVTDVFFGAPWLDVDEERAEPRPHRYVHGGFAGTDTRFSMYFPPAAEYGGRFLHCIGGGRGGSEHTALSPAGVFGGGFGMAFDHAAYLVESNQGHLSPDDLCPKAGDDTTVYAYRASAEAARFARHVADEVYGSAPAHGYLFGGSGGGNRSIACIEHEPELWAGALSITFGNPYRSFRANGAMFGAVHQLGDALARVVDATEVGGADDPFDGLTTLQREALRDAYRLGFPRGAEATMGGDISLATWTLHAQALMARDPEYFRAYFAEPGHRGFDVLADAVLDVTTTVTGVFTAGDLASRATGPGAAMLRWRDPSATIGVTLADELTAPARTLTVTVLTGDAEGRVLHGGSTIDDVLVASPFLAGEVQKLVYLGVQPGDEVRLENRPFLAYCDWYRHHVLDGPEYDFTKLDGRPLYPQHPHVDEPDPVFGELPATGRFDGKVVMLNATLSGPGERVGYHRLVREHLGDATDDRYRLWSIECGGYTPTPSPGIEAGQPAPTTKYVDYSGWVPQAMRDLVAWVEDGTPPPSTTAYAYDSYGRFAMPADASARGGIQPVVDLTADGGVRAEVGVGATVTFEARAGVPPGAGALVGMRFDPDGTGAWPHEDVIEPATSLTSTWSHAYDAPGTYFPAVMVTSQREGDAVDVARRVHNLGRVRVVVA
jgi:hypothetical protein